MFDDMFNSLLVLAAFLILGAFLLGIAVGVLL